MIGLTENTALIGDAIAYVIKLYRELSAENGAPTLGTQNQTVDFILADPELSRAVRKWAERARPGEAAAAPPRRLPLDEAYRRIEAFMRSVMQPPVFG
ncbi:MAG TPA: hypothetical protein VNV18_14015 [Stellaceae bacterium]|jgi:hypothetical protein|nr:hypothetical protein [Stellaceae bacterium]